MTTQARRKTSHCHDARNGVTLLECHQVRLTPTWAFVNWERWSYSAPDRELKAITGLIYSIMHRYVVNAHRMHIVSRSGAQLKYTIWLSH